MKRENRKIRFLFCLISFIFSCPSAVSAQVIISEIMYDAEGPDDGREWVEIYNGGSENIDLSGWSFYEADTNHKLTSENSYVLNAGSYAIIANDATQFLSEWPSLEALVLDSSFSLRSKDNIGEYIAIRDADKNETDGLTYKPLELANGTGNSLQKIDGDWAATFPTPGKASADDALPYEEVEEGGGNADNGSQIIGGQSSSGGGGGSSFPIEPQIIAYAGKDRTVIVGADSEYEGQTLGLNKEPLKNARYIWNFGNGATAEGKKILHHYEYPGEYIVILTVSSGEYSASDRIDVKAKPADIIISAVDSDFIEIYSRTDDEINLSLWRLRAGSEHFTLPRDTIILPDKKLIFTSAVTGLDTINTDIVELQYPNGSVAAAFKEVLAISDNHALADGILSKAPLINKTVANSAPSEVENTKAEIIVEAKGNENETSLIEHASAFSAAAQAGGGRKNGGVSKWLLALVGIMAVSAFAILFFKDNTEEKDEIKILE
jgi:hypothetical protein